MEKRIIKSEKGIYNRYVKRLLDFVLSLFLILILSPLLLILAILNYIYHGSPILFHQERPGYKGNIFMMKKFRSMTNETDEDGELLPENIRITKYGNFLRKTSLDELPELFNILKGEMSFIGPRPLLVKYIPYYTDQEYRRHSVRPGLTGYAQVKGRNTLRWSERFEYDLYYVDNCSFTLDVKIFFLTIYKVLKGADIADLSQDGMDEYGKYTVINDEKYRAFHIERQIEWGKKAEDIVK